MFSYQDISLTEIPGEVSLVIYNPRCNMKCEYCFNSNLLNKKPLSYKQMKDMVNEHRDFIGGVVFSGGEPLTNPFLRKILQYCSDNGLKTKLNTNGFVPNDVRSNRFTPFVDYANISLKEMSIPYCKLHKSDWTWIPRADVLEYSLVYSPTLWPFKKITDFANFIDTKISYDWRTMFSDKWSRPDIFTISQLQIGNCLNQMYNNCRVPTEKECIEVAQIFAHIPRKKLIVETKENGRITI